METNILLIAHSAQAVIRQRHTIENMDRMLKAFESFEDNGWKVTLLREDKLRWFARR